MPERSIASHDSLVVAPICGEPKKFGTSNSGLPFAGSAANTSNAAAAMCPLSSRALSACSSTIAPRAQLTRMPPGSNRSYPLGTTKHRHEAWNAPNPEYHVKNGEHRNRDFVDARRPPHLDPMLI